MDSPVDGVDRGVLAFDGGDKPLWRSDFHGSVKTLRAGALDGTETRIFAYDESANSVRRVDAQSGTTRWTHSFDEFGSQFLEVGASLIWAVGDGVYVTGLDPENGEVRANYTAPASVTSLTFADQWLYVGTYGAGLVALTR